MHRVRPKSASVELVYDFHRPVIAGPRCAAHPWKAGYPEERKSRADWLPTYRLEKLDVGVLTANVLSKLTSLIANDASHRRWLSCATRQVALTIACKRAHTTVVHNWPNDWAVSPAKMGAHVSGILPKIESSRIKAAMLRVPTPVFVHR